MAERPDAVSFYNISEYIHSLTILDNILYGKPTNNRPRAQERISESIMQFLEEENLLGRIIEIGLHFVVGQKGNDFPAAKNKNRHRQGAAQVAPNSDHRRSDIRTR